MGYLIHLAKWPGLKTLVADFKKKKWPVSCSYYLGWKPTDGTECQSGSRMGWSRGGFAESLSEGFGLGGT